MKSLPPRVREFSSPSGAWLLQVRGPENWRPSRAKAELFSLDGKIRRSRWTKELPHRYGPGTAMVFDSGRVLLLDEWMKTPSPYAVVLLNQEGMEVAAYSMEDVAEIAGVPQSTLVQTARQGPWMSSPPRAEDSRAVLEAGGAALHLDLASGRLQRAGGVR